MPDPAKINETTLLQRIAQGDETAFSCLFYTYHQELGNYLLHLTKSVALAEDIVQDTFIKIWTGREALADINHFRSYLFAISRNHALNCLRNIARESIRRRNWVLTTATIPLSDLNESGEAYRTIIEIAITRLPPQQQKIYRLSRQKGLKYEDIAQKLHLSPSTVKRHISLALKNIRAYLLAHVHKTPLILTAGYILL